MRKRLQQYADSPYERPNQNWVCGQACAGVSCPLGPSTRGKCPAGPACFPQLIGERWQCGRTEAAGGPCATGPHPDGSCCQTLSCTPAPSQRVRRGRWIAASLVFALGCVLIVLNAEWRNEVLAPGPLTQAHAQIIRRDKATERCATCHTAGNSTLWQWCRWSAGMEPALGPPQWELCLKCHEKTIPTAVALLPHSLPAAVLSEKSSAIVATATVKRAGLSFSLGTKRESLACGVCHREHHGTEYSLTKLTNEQCQACHKQAFHSLAEGHPEFRDWPYAPPQRIAFSHQSHAGKHFATAKQEFACALCHVDDPQRNAKLLNSFEATCAKCHDEKIQASTLEGIAFLAVPTLDVDALRAAGHEIPVWPAAATGDFDGRLPWPMQRLLATDAEAAAALPLLGSDADFANLQANRPQHLAAAAQLARGIGRLIAEMERDGEAALRARLTKVDAEQGDVKLPREFTRGLSPATLATVWRWFPERSPQTSSGDRKIRRTAFSDDDLLTDEPSPPATQPQPLTPPPGVGKPTPAADEDDLLGTPSSVGNPLRNPSDNGNRTAPAGDAPTPDRVAIKPGDMHGVWQADGNTLTLRYFPSGHADSVLKLWLDALTNPPGDPSSLTAGRSAALHANSQGQCGKCHTQSAAADSTATQIIWKSQPYERRGFTKFSHRPHLVQPHLADCSHCHRLNGDSPTPDAQFVQHQDRPVHRSDFAPLTKNACVSCHRRGAAGDDCTQCHRYHVDERALPHFP